MKGSGTTNEVEDMEERRLGAMEKVKMTGQH